jgi:hypothetical protein
LKSGGTTDRNLQKAIQSEKGKWREILKIVLDVTLFCARNNIAFRATNEVTGHPQVGLFLNLIELLGHYNPLLKQHIETHKKGSVDYLSPAVQNEFITLLANHVRSQIITRVKNTKYYSLMSDCTPDSSHEEQMSEILRYVYVTERRVTIEESFVDFI